VLANKRHEIQPVYGVRVDELALAGILWGLGFGGCKGVGFRGPEEGAVRFMLVLVMVTKKGMGDILGSPVIHAIEKLSQYVCPDDEEVLQAGERPGLFRL
jgi:hypothetical protein